jgi:hypothetical protein
MTSNPLIGVGLRYPHYRQVLDELPSIGWFEVHSENFLAPGGSLADFLLKLRAHYPISLHGVGLSLGSADGLSIAYLERLRNLITRVQPQFVSEHLSWGYVDGVYMPDLLPVPYTEESFHVLKTNILLAEEVLKKEILIENPSSYIEYTVSQQSEVEFLVTLCQATGAKILLDVNNVYVSSWNHGWDAREYIDSIPENLVKEIHLAGHSIKELPNDQILRVDTHDRYVCEEVWTLYDYAIQRFGSTPTLLEWDADIPPLDVLVSEALNCERFLTGSSKTNLRAANA